MPKAAKPTDAGAVRYSALWSAIGFVAGKRGDRSMLADGSETPVAVQISGTVGRAKLSDSFSGKLLIAEPAAASSSAAAPAAEVLALVLAEIGDADRQAAIMESITARFESAGKRLPSADPQSVARVEQWLKRLRSTVTTTKRGALTFAFKAAAVLCLAVLLAGCAGLEQLERPEVVPLPPPAAEVPVVDLPTVLREWNWTDRNGSGSCVHASTVYHLRWQNQLELARQWRQTYAGGETATSIQRLWAGSQIPYVATEAGDPDFLDWATRTRRGAIIWFFPRHCVHFCGWSTIDGRTYALLCDNNRVERYLRVPREEFIRRWREYGGFAATALFAPAPPLPWPAYQLADASR
jgi:hypothetical protein